MNAVIILRVRVGEIEQGRFRVAQDWFRPCLRDSSGKFRIVHCRENQFSIEKREEVESSKRCFWEWSIGCNTSLQLLEERYSHVSVPFGFIACALLAREEENDCSCLFDFLSPSVALHLRARFMKFYERSGTFKLSVWVPIDRSLGFVSAS